MYFFNESVWKSKDKRNDLLENYGCINFSDTNKGQFSILEMSVYFEHPYLYCPLLRNICRDSYWSPLPRYSVIWKQQPSLDLEIYDTIILSNTWLKVWAILWRPKKILALQNFVGIFQKFLDFFSSNSEKNIIFRGRFSQKILLNDYDFWQFSINPWYVRVYGKLRKH